MRKKKLTQNWSFIAKHLQANFLTDVKLATVRRFTEKNGNPPLLLVPIERIRHIPCEGMGNFWAQLGMDKFSYFITKINSVVVSCAKILPVTNVSSENFVAS